MVHEGPAIPLGKKGGFAGTHILVPRRGVAVHINAFNFPVWGLLEKFAPTFLAGMPCIGKPATATSYLTEALVRLIDKSGLLPEGALQLVIGGTGDLLDRLDGQDVVTFTGSADTAAKLRVHPNIVKHSIPFNAEADSLNCAILAPDVTPDDEEFDLFVKEVAREMTVKAGQKCTAIRRAIVPREHLDCGGRAAARRAWPRRWSATRRTRPCAWARWRRTRRPKTWPSAWPSSRAAPNWCIRRKDGFTPHRRSAWPKARSSRPRCCWPRTPMSHAAHDVEAFGPVSTLMPYDTLDEALALAAQAAAAAWWARWSRKDPATAAHVVPQVAAWHGRLLVLDREAAVESTGHGTRCRASSTAARAAPAAAKSWAACAR